MSEDTPKKERRGAKPKAGDLPSPKDTRGHGGAREGSGQKPKYKRIDVAQRLEDLNFDVVLETLKLYAKAVEDDDKKIADGILARLAEYSAAKFRAVESGEGESNTYLDIIAAMAGRQRPPPKGSK